MKTQSGREIKIAISPRESIEIRGHSINVYNAIRKVECISKTRVKQRGGTVILISEEVIDAIRAYERADGYADLKLSDYLTRLFGG